MVSAYDMPYINVKWGHYAEIAFCWLLFRLVLKKHEQFCILLVQ